MDECQGQTDCDLNADCSNTEGSYDCTCRNGYSGNGRQCTGNNSFETVGLILENVQLFGCVNAS